MNYPKEALVYRLIDYRSYRYIDDAVLELVGISKYALCLALKPVDSKVNITYWLMRGELMPLTPAAKTFLNECLPFEND